MALIATSFVLFIILMVTGVLPTPSDSDKPSTLDRWASEANNAQASTVHHMNETVNVGYWSYTVTRVRWGNTIGPSFAPEHADAKFLQVYVTIRNNDRTPSTLPPLKLLDPEGREYETSSKGALMHGSFDLLKDVNPTVTSHGFVVFDVPFNTYRLLVSGGFESGKTATIQLD